MRLHVRPVQRVRPRFYSGRAEASVTGTRERPALPCSAGRSWVSAPLGGLGGAASGLAVAAAPGGLSGSGVPAAGGRALGTVGTDGGPGVAVGGRGGVGERGGPLRLLEPDDLRAATEGRGGRGRVLARRAVRGPVGGHGLGARTAPGGLAVGRAVTG